MNPHHPRRSRARPRVDYSPHTIDLAKERGQQQQRRRTYSGYGVLYIRCGGGWRVLRRDYLPGEDGR